MRDARQSTNTVTDAEKNAVAQLLGLLLTVAQQHRQGSPESELLPFLLPAKSAASDTVFAASFSTGFQQRPVQS